jgi:hopene-associated glycosyltransferase HpnB
MSLLALMSLAIWAVLWLFRGGFWNAAEDLPIGYSDGRLYVTAVIPARNEEATIARAVRSLRHQVARIIVVDDRSSDATAAVALAAGAEVVHGAPLPEGWSGKVWAMHQGIAAAGPAEWILLTDADIEHHENNVGELLARAERQGLDLASLMVRLNCESLAERLLIPAFVYFFRMLYPFAWANDPESRTAAAAGGCMLVRRAALDRIGGMAAIRGALIDDCALAAALKRSGGSIWLGLTQRTLSLRPYPALEDIWRMVARTAYTQLQYSPFALAFCALAMTVVFLVPPLAVLDGDDWGLRAGGLAWALMALSYLPMLRFYGVSPLWAPLLPAIALVYLGATIDSARRHWEGRGGEWKGRTLQS